MAKSRSSRNSRQNSKKKRDKRRLLKQQAAPSCSCKKMDVSGWFDNPADHVSEFMDVFYPKAPDLPSRIYENALPGELYFNWYAHEHPDEKDEQSAAGLIKHFIFAEIKAVLEPEDWNSKKKAILKDLEKLAKNGCITAASYLGFLYANGGSVRKNRVRAERYLRLGAGKNNPVACFWLAHVTEGAESVQLLDKSCEGGCPAALYKMSNDIKTGSRKATGPELDMLAGYLAALAGNGSMRSLQELLDLLGAGYGEELRPVYAPAMLSLLDRLVAENYVPAVEYKAELYANGTLCPQDTEEAGRLYQKAIASGSAIARIRYATCLLQETRKEDMTLEAKKEKVRTARKILEEEYPTGGGDDYVIAGLLGSVLVMSDDDADFRRGIQYFEENISQNYFDMALRSVSNILLWSDDKKRHKTAIRLLNIMVRKKNPNAIYIRGRLYLHGGLLGQADIVKGVTMLLDATKMGMWESCYLMAELRLFGLYHAPADTDKAALIASFGSMQYGSRQCDVLYSLIQIGELPDCTDRQADGAQIEEYVRRMQKDPGEDCYLSIAVAMVWLDCDSPLSNYFRSKGLRPQDSHEGELRTIVDKVAAECDHNMQRCNLGPLCYAVHALRKIGKTRHAALAAGIFAKKLHLGQSFGCDDIADYLQVFLDLVPASSLQYRLTYGSNKADTKRPMY